MKSLLRGARHRFLEIAAVICVGCLGVAVYGLLIPVERGTVTSLRNSDFPKTFISRIHLDLTSPHHYVTLAWTGPLADQQETGPFRSCPGAGLGFNDCNDPVESNCPGSQCTPKGLRTVEGFRDAFDKFPECKFLTVIDAKRAISFHYHPKVLDYPASQGCIRMDEYPAQLIHNNAKVGDTEVLIDGEWTRPAEVAEEKNKSLSQNPPRP